MILLKFGRHFLQGFYFLCTQFLLLKFVKILFFLSQGKKIGPVFFPRARYLLQNTGYSFQGNLASVSIPFLEKKVA